MHTSRCCIWCILLVLATYLTVFLTRRLLFLITLVLIVREVYLEHNGNTTRGPGPMNDAIKDGNVRMDYMDSERGVPMSDPNL
jgi:hypothetical protein